MKIQEVKRILTRWQPSSFTLYREVFTQYGGSINMHPDIVDYFMKRHNWHFNSSTIKKMIRLKAPTLSVMIRILAS
ncbi:antimicrobial resistance protein Mig-14 [Salmonella enterica subsp. enterica]|uniref:Antimicrobial resistance protein Mig-14 n=1 Tax=Salmonella enterica I TaxID=59201 RepID=A0A447N5I6_SALET|nr:antimicrobial resistance protein Mig-14 [Salmonella enterica subsp. enterica]